MTTATSTEQSTDNSYAFLKRPPFLFKKVLTKVSRGRLGISVVEGALHRAVPLIFDGFDINLPATHRDGGATAEASATLKLSMFYWIRQREL